MIDRLVVERLVQREEAGRDFDIEFWQALGDTTVFAAASAIWSAAKSMTVEDSLNLNLICQIGVEPFRVDVMSCVAGLD